MWKYFFVLWSFFISPWVFAQFDNIMISDVNQPNEPSISIDIYNTNTLFAATNLNNYYVSNDGGHTWNYHRLTSSYGVYGDPALMFDNNHNLLYFHLSNPVSGGNWIDRIVCQKSTNNGNTFNNGSYAGLNGNKVQDKPWPNIDRSNGNIYVTWTEFDHYDSNDANDKSRILFSKSTDNGNSWSTPVKINKIDGDCNDSDNTVEGAVPAVGPNGEIYVAWAGPAGIRFNRSTDYGTTWLNDPVFIDAQPTGWDYSIPGIFRSNGLPITLCDLSRGPYKGTIYVNWSDQRNGANDTDIWLRKSTDGGNTWSDLIRVNNDAPGKQQFLSWMTIDQTTGYLYCVFYDRRNHNDHKTDVYLAYSTNGGESFTNVKISASAFLPYSGAFFGDYTNITAHDGVIRPIWTRLHNGQLSVWTAIINQPDLLAINSFQMPNDLSAYPNLLNDEASIYFKINEKDRISIKITDTQGRHIVTLLNHKNFEAGKHFIRIPVETYHLQSGIYFYTLTGKNLSIRQKIIIE